MSDTAIETDIMIAFVLLNIPEQVGMARCLVRAVLDYRELGHYADDAEIVASELVTNAMQHVSLDPAEKIGVTLARVWNGEAITVVVTDSSPIPPVRLSTTANSDHGRGLQAVEALSVHWDWHPEDDGKAVYAILAKEEQQAMADIPGPAGAPQHRTHLGNSARTRQGGKPGSAHATGDRGSDHRDRGGPERAGRPREVTIVADIPGLPRRRLDVIPKRQSKIVGANIRTLRQRKRWTQVKLGELMGWHSTSTACAAEGHRNDRQCGFTTEEVGRLAAIFGVTPSQLTTQREGLSRWWRMTK